MLYSSFPASRKQRADQDRAIQQLEGRNLPYYKIDGFDPTYAKARYELFLISGIKGEYPQFFCKDSNDNITYIGDFNRVQDINEDSGLSETIIGAHPLIMTWDRLLDAGYRNQLLVLITGSNIHKKQANDQKSALDLLEMKKIPHAVLDGGDSETKEL